MEKLQDGRHCACSISLRCSKPAIELELLRSLSAPVPGVCYAVPGIRLGAGDPQVGKNCLLQELQAIEEMRKRQVAWSVNRSKA